MKSAYEDITSPKTFVHWRWEKSWLACQCEEGKPNEVYAIAVKTDMIKTVQVRMESGVGEECM